MPLRKRAFLKKEEEVVQLKSSIPRLEEAVRRGKTALGGEKEKRLDREAKRLLELDSSLPETKRIYLEHLRRTLAPRIMHTRKLRKWQPRLRAKPSHQA